MIKKYILKNVGNNKLFLIKACKIILFRIYNIMPEISDGEYKKLLSDSAEKERLEGENKKLTETAENTAKGLKANREEIKWLKKEKEDLETNVQTLENEKEEIEKKYEWFDEIKEKAEKFDTTQAEAETKRTENIDKMKETLWDEFLEKNEYLLDWMEPSKMEKFLESNIEAQWKDKPVIETGAPAGWMKPPAWTEHATDFDKAIESGDAMAALSAIPDPS